MSKSKSLIPFAVTVVVVGVVAALLVKFGRGPRPGPDAAPPIVTDRAAPSPPEVVGGEDTVILSPAAREMPGAVPTWCMRYRNARAQTVSVAGSWDRWAKMLPLTRKENLWEFDVSDMKLGMGNYAFKFVVDGEWEPGENRRLHIRPDGLIGRPPEAIFAALQEAPERIDIIMRVGVKPGQDVNVRLVPAAGISHVEWVGGDGAGARMGFRTAGDYVTFVFDPAVYGVSLTRFDRVFVAGSFNGWRADSAPWELKDIDESGVRKLTARLDGVASGAQPQFKFVINGRKWLPVPNGVRNRALDNKGNSNLRVIAGASTVPVLRVHLSAPLPLDKRYTVFVEGVAESAVYRDVTPAGVLDSLVSNKPLGATLDKASNQTCFRLFAPRASHVEVCLFDQPIASAAPPTRIEHMIRDADGVWTAVLPGLLPGAYYAYRVDGPSGVGEGFNPDAYISDPYARAVSHASNLAVVIDPDATNSWFAGWGDESYRTPAPADVVIYETHVRHLTIDSSSRVPKRLRGTYAGLLASRGLGTGLDHLKALGVNMIEFMPVHEYENGEDRHDWGYGPAFFFAPEASFARAPLEGSQYYEFKNMVNTLHQQGFGVILDVVYNHVGSPNIFALLDRQYYFRQDEHHNLSNFSGCGNDMRSEAPMMRRLILDNIKYWMTEHHVDGFRFDLAELIDMKTLMEVRDMARKINPNVLLISEPWSFRGDHREALAGTGWAAWNSNFRDDVRSYVLGHGNRDALKGVIAGSQALWTANPLQSVNYLESHDDMCFADSISSHPGRDARELIPLDVARNRIAATLLMTSLGIPMIAEGQDWVRSKHGFHNTYDRGDAVNALFWEDRERGPAEVTSAFYAGLIALRRSAAGEALRWRDTVPADYIRWLEPPDSRGLGYLINPERRYPGSAFAVLVNASKQPLTFQIPFPSGQWRVISDGRQVASDGLVSVNTGSGDDGRRVIRVPAVRAYILMATE